jgi:predicted dehydrogenase
VRQSFEIEHGWWSPVKARLEGVIMVSRRQLLQSAFVLPVGALVVEPAVMSAPGTAAVRLAVIGHTGRGNYGHGLDTMWQQIPEVQICAVADADPAGLAAAVNLLKPGKSYSDYHVMLAEQRPEVVAVGPRHVDQHRDMLLAAIQHGVRGIYIEKPFVRTPAEADEVLRAANAAGVRSAVAHRNRFHPVLPVLRQLLADGKIGRVLEYRGRGKEDARGGALDLWVLGSHVMNLAAYFGGSPVAVSATLLQDGRLVQKADVREGAEGIGLLAGNELHARFELQSGLPFFFDSVQHARRRDAATDRPASFGLQIIGTEGVIDLRADQHPLAAIREGSPFDPDFAQPRAWQVVSSAGIGKPEPDANLAQTLTSQVLPGRDLLAAMRESRQPLCDGEQGRQTIEMICGVFESHRLNGQRVNFPLQTRVNPLSLL